MKSIFRRFTISIAPVIFGICSAVVFISALAIAQVTQQGTSGLPAPQLFGNGAPAASYTCNSSIAGVAYIQLDATNGRLWICDSSSGSLAWDQQLNAVKNVVTGATPITVGSLILGGCNTTVTVTVPGAVVGTNAAAVEPIFTTAPTGNMGLLNVTGWVSAANTVSVQACAFGSLSPPTFLPKILLY